MSSGIERLAPSTLDARLGAFAGDECGRERHRPLYEIRCAFTRALLGSALDDGLYREPPWPAEPGLRAATAARNRTV